MINETANLNFEPAEKEWIESFAEVTGKSFTALVREWTLQRLEDELEARDLKEQWPISATRTIPQLAH